MPFSGGGIIAIPGIPVLLGGCKSSELLRDLWDMMGWLKQIGKLELKKAWSEVVTRLIGKGGGAGFQSNRRTRTRLPEDLCSFATRSWVSPGGATLFNEVPPLTETEEKKIVCALLTDLNNLYSLDLDTNPDFTRKTTENTRGKGKVLVIGASLAGRTADEFSERGYEVIRICTPGWRANKHPVQTIIPQVKEAVQKLDKDDHVIIQCLDNTAYYSRTEEGGDIPVRRYIDGEFHVEGDLVLASKERQYLMFECILPLLQAVGIRNIILVTPGPRYLYESCCALEEHAPNRMDENFEETLRSSLRECRLNFKTFCFTHNIKAKVVDPSPVLTLMDEDGEDVWGVDPVHPLLHGFRLLVDLLETEMEGQLNKNKRKAASQKQPSAKKPRVETPRPSWVQHNPATAERREWNDKRGGRGGRGGGAGRRPGGRGRRGWGRGG
jgi:hypothetical protein